MKVRFCRFFVTVIIKKQVGVSFVNTSSVGNLINFYRTGFSTEKDIDLNKNVSMWYYEETYSNNNKKTGWRL